MEALLLSVKEQRANFRAAYSDNASAGIPAITLEIGHIPGPIASKHNTLIPAHHTLRPGFPHVPHITAWITGTDSDTNTPDPHTAPVGNDRGTPSLSITVDAERTIARNSSWMASSRL